MSEKIKELLDANAQWANEVSANDPAFFEGLAKGQSPEYLWIGCSDSRVPVNQITNSKPGSIFVQRNIANMVVSTDTNLLSVVNYAVKHLKVKHIVICGHYGCGGVQAAMSNSKLGFLDGWLSNIKDVFLQNSAELELLSEADKFNRMVELNVIEQVKNMAKISFVQEEWDNGTTPTIHGMVFSLKDGLLKDLNTTISSKEDLADIYRFNAIS